MSPTNLLFFRVGQMPAAFHHRESNPDPPVFDSGGASTT